MEEILFTPSSVIALLSQIEELKDKEIVFNEPVGDTITFTIGSTEYTVDCGAAADVEVSEDVIFDINEADEEGYQDLEEVDAVTVSEEPVEGGILRELAKTLLVGGLVRLTTNALKK